MVVTEPAGFSFAIAAAVRIYALDSLLCVFVSVAFAAFALSMRAVSRSGAAAGVLICFLLCMGGGFRAVAAVIAVFVMAWLTTKLGTERKQRLGTAEKTEGRNASQVMANLGVATLCAAAYLFDKYPVFLLAIAASLAEAAADTVSSEIGQLSNRRPRLITTWAQVPAGTDGGVTVLGTLSGLAAASVVSLVCGFGGLIPWRRIGIPILAAVCGMFADSFFGAWLERRNFLNNELVNFLGTLVAALIAMIV